MSRLELRLLDEAGIVIRSERIELANVEAARAQAHRGGADATSLMGMRASIGLSTRLEVLDPDGDIAPAGEWTLLGVIGPEVVAVTPLGARFLFPAGPPGMAQP